MIKQKALEDFTDDEVLQLFVEDCFVPPESNQVVPDFVIHQLLKLYCGQIGLASPTKAKMTNMMRKYYTQTMKDQQVCYRVAIRPGLIQEDL